MLGTAPALGRRGRLLSDRELAEQPLKWLKYLVMDRVGLEPIEKVATQIHRFNFSTLHDAERWCENRLADRDTNSLVVAKVVPWDVGAQLENFRIYSAGEIQPTFAEIVARYGHLRHEIWGCDSSIAASGFNVGGRFTFPYRDSKQTMEIVWFGSPREIESVRIPGFDKPYLKAIRHKFSGALTPITEYLPEIHNESIDLEVMRGDAADLSARMRERTAAITEVAELLRGIGAQEICFCFKMSRERLTIID